DCLVAALLFPGVVAALLAMLARSLVGAVEAGSLVVVVPARLAAVALLVVAVAIVIGRARARRRAALHIGRSRGAGRRALRGDLRRRVGAGLRIHVDLRV